MRVLIAHNHYQQAGGEDRVFEAEAALLERRGHSVVRHAVHNEALEGKGRVALAASAVWNRDSHAEVLALLRRHRPDVVHVHNTLALLSPSIYYAAATAGVPVVQTVHNYRLLCPSAVLYRAGGVCEACVGRSFAWPGVLHGCYREDRAATAVLGGMVAIHRAVGTWRKRVAQYIALTEFARTKLLEAGLPADRVIVKPNFLGSDPGTGAHAGGYAIFVGRLTPEKGVATLLSAWERMVAPIPLKIAGTGPLEYLVRRAPPPVEWIGYQPGSAIIELMKNAAILIFPSEWYEGFPITLVEAFATGTPVIAARLGAMAELIEDGRTGMHFTAGDADDLVRAVERARGRQAETVRMGENARREFELNYTADRNYEQLMTVYERVRQGGRVAASS